MSRLIAHWSARTERHATVPARQGDVEERIRIRYCPETTYTQLCGYPHVIERQRPSPSYIRILHVRLLILPTPF